MPDDILLREQIYGGWALPVYSHPLYSNILLQYHYAEIYRASARLTRTVSGQAQVSRTVDSRASITRTVSADYDELEKL